MFVRQMWRLYLDSAQVEKGQTLHLNSQFSTSSTPFPVSSPHILVPPASREDAQKKKKKTSAKYTPVHRWLQLLQKGIETSFNMVRRDQFLGHNWEDGGVWGETRVSAATGTKHHREQHVDSVSWISKTSHQLRLFCVISGDFKSEVWAAFQLQLDVFPPHMYEFKKACKSYVHILLLCHFTYLPDTYMWRYSWGERGESEV